MKYEISIDRHTGDSYTSLTWTEELTRDDVKNFFSPSDNTVHSVIYPPEVEAFLDDGEALTDDEYAKLEDDIRTQVDDFEIDVILPDSLKLWMDDLTDEYTRLSHELPGYEACYRDILSMPDQENAVREMYTLVQNMKSQN